MTAQDTSGSVPKVTAEQIREARAELEGVSIYTPMEESRWLSALADGPVYLKAENLQRTGSFKIRGAYLRISRLPEEQQRAGVVAASAGNHAQGVALAARMLGIHATVFMPEGAAIPKERATRGYGAEVRFGGATIDEALERALDFSNETGAVLIHPFDHADIVAGQGTLGLEVLEQAPDLRTLLVPAGGTGLVAGVAIAVKSERPDVRVVAVQAAGAASLPASLSAGSPTALAGMYTMADGIAVGRPGQVPFQAVRELVDDVVLVSEESLSWALLSLVERAKMVVEPAGAAGVAALLDDPTAFETPAVAVLSGGNVDPLLLGKVIRHGMAVDGRFLVLRVRIPDIPGGLAGVVTTLGGAGANVLEIAHERLSPTLSVDEVEVSVHLETRGAPHAEEVVAALRERGYTVLD